jgi:colanic acid biosynthesis glycosyl transferase WcaI
MKILLLNMYYPPDTSATAKMAATVAEALAARHEVTILCGRPSYDPSERRPWRLWKAESGKTGRIVRVGSTTYARFAMKTRVINYLTYTALAIPRSLFLKCDVVLAMTDPPFEGIVGAIVAALKRKPYVYNIRDLYPDMAIAGEIMPQGVLSQVWERLDRWALHRATRIVVLGEDMRARIVAKDVQPERMKIVRDGTEIASLKPTATELDHDVVRSIRGEDRFVLLHAGNLGFYGAWQTLIRAVQSLADEGVGLVFVGGGAQSERIQAMANGAKNVRFLPFFPASKIASVLAAPDAHVITVRRGLEGVVVPSKMYGILAAGKPIVAVAPAETDAASLGARYGFAVSADPDKPEEITETIRSLARNPEGLASMGRRAQAVAPDYDRVNELQKFVQILEEAVHA